MVWAIKTTVFEISELEVKPLCAKIAAEMGKEVTSVKLSNSGKKNNHSLSERRQYLLENRSWPQECCEERDMA